MASKQDVDTKSNDAGAKITKKTAPSEPANGPRRCCTRGGKGKGKGEPPAPMAPMSALFRFADKCDGFLMTLGIIGALCGGAYMPLFSLLLGDLLNDINNPNPELAADGVEGIALIFFYVGCALCVAGFLKVFGFAAAAKRQTHVFRLRYYKSMLRQDIGWHDETEGSEFTSKLADSTEKLKDAIGVKFADSILNISSFVVGLGVGLYTSWKLALVILTFLPILMVVGAALGGVMSRGTKNTAEAYAVAGGVAEESIASIRTITSLNAQFDMYRLYSSFLGRAQTESTKTSMLQGIVFGVLFMSIFAAYCLAFWYGSTLLVDHTQPLEGGDILTVFFSVLFGALNLGQIGPSMAAIKDARAVRLLTYLSLYEFSIV